MILFSQFDFVELNFMYLAFPLFSFGLSDKEIALYLTLCECLISPCYALDVLSDIGMGYCVKALLHHGMLLSNMC